MGSNLKYKFIGVLLAIFSFTTVEVRSQNPDSILNMIEDFGNFLLYRNHDTNYIRNLGDKVSVSLVGVSKFNYFRVREKINNSKLRYRPVRDVSLGAGVSYKWFSLDVTFSLGLRKKSEFENSLALDFQGKIFSSKQYISGTLQYYKGYKLSGLTGTPDVSIVESERREDIRTIIVGLQYLYALNYTRFSMKAPFELNEIQRKSAGSIILGASFSVYVMDADSSIVPPQLSSSFDPKARIVDMNILTLTLNAGYMYSFVYKEHYFLTLGMIPGLSFTGGDYLSDQRRISPPRPNIRISTMNALGYNGDNFFAGINLIVDIQFTRLVKNISAEVGHGKAGLFIGYRF